LSLLYLAKFTSSFPDQETVDEWASLWAEGLAGIDGEQIKFGLSYVAQKHEWPPTLAEFRACCEARPKPDVPLLPVVLVASERVHGIVAQVKEKMSQAPKPVLHWRKVLATPGLPEISYRYAKEALAIIDSYNTTEHSA